jgi:hypothetical protein
MHPRASGIGSEGQTNTQLQGGVDLGQLVFQVFFRHLGKRRIASVALSLQESP